MSWSGSFTNEAFAGPGTYQAETGVRCFIDMAMAPGPVVIDAPLTPDEGSSFIISWNNPGRHILAFDGPDDFENPVSIDYEIVPDAALRFSHGSVAFTFVNGVWEIFDWTLFGVNLRVNFAVRWIGRGTNGLCTVLGDYKAFEVERTAEGFYTVRLDAGAVSQPQLLLHAPQAIGLPIESSAELLDVDVGMANPNEIVINSGYRNKNGQFSDDDLIQDPSNFMAIIGQKFP